MAEVDWSAFNAMSQADRDALAALANQGVTAEDLTSAVPQQTSTDWDAFNAMSAADRQALTDLANQGYTAEDLQGTGQYFNTPGQTTGYSDDGNYLVMWDPNAGETGEYVTRDVSDESFQSRMDFKEANNLGYYTNVNGDYVYGIKPTSTYQASGGSDDTTRIEGVDPDWQTRTIPDMSGIGRFGGGQRTPENTGSYVDPTMVWQGSDSHDREGNIIPGGPADPNSRPVYERGTPFAGSVNDTFGRDIGGAVSGPAPIDWAANQYTDSPLIGYESSSNKDFYQQQFADMRNQQMTDRMRQNAAASYQPPEQTNVMDDPWSWANLPEVVEGGAGAANPNEWILNPNYNFTPETTHAEVIGQLSGLNTFNDEERRWFNDFLNENPQLQTDTQWTDDRTGALSGIQTSEMGPKPKDRLNRILNNVWIQAGDAPTPGGQMVPPGYASPTNA